MRAITSKVGDLLYYFDKNKESQSEINNTSLKHLLVNNHDIAANKGKTRKQKPLEIVFGFFRPFRKITEQLGIHLSLKTADLQDIIVTTLGDNNKVNFDKLFLFVPIFIPDA